MQKSMGNVEIADLLRAVAASYQIKDQNKNRFKIIAYNKAADAVEHLSSEAKDLWDDGKLADVVGIGESIATHLDEIFRTGTSKHFEKVMKEIPPAVFELLKIGGVGPKNGIRLVRELKITDKNPIEQLLKHAEAGHIATLEGFGEDSQNAIMKSIEEVSGRQRRLLLPYATENAERILEWMRKSRFVKRAEALGSLRRKVSTIGDLDIAVAADNTKEAIDHFIKYPDSKRTLEKGDISAGIIIPPDLEVDLMVLRPSSFGSLLQHFTGSKDHNIALREYAQRRGLSLSEKGIKIVKKEKEFNYSKFKNYNKKTNFYEFTTEREFYEALGMEFIVPELREDMGEIEAALLKKLPKLIELPDIKGDLQIHSDFNIETSHDLGASPMEEILKKAGELKYEYVAFTEHNPGQKGHNDRQIVDILKRKKERVDILKVKSLKSGRPYPFNSLEIDILPSGRLPVPEEGLKLLDFALISIHSSFRLARKETTKRVLSAISDPQVKIFAHPTGRKLNEREGVDLNWDEIFDFCLKNDKWIEINCDPMRLDLPDVLVREAVKLGVKLTLGTDSHHFQYMDNMRFGISVARRGWAAKNDIVNSRSLAEIKKMLKLKD